MATSDGTAEPGLQTGDHRADESLARTRENKESFGVFASMDSAHFRVLLVSSAIAFMAMQAEMMARGYLAYILTNSAIALGIVQLAWGAPTFVLGLFGGALADRVEKRSLLVAAQVLSIVSTLAVSILLMINRIEIWHLVSAGLVTGVVLSLQLPARNSILPDLVGKARLANAIALTTVGNNLSRIVGPAAAGALMAATWFGMANTFFLITTLYVLALFLTFLLPASPGPTTGPRESLLESVKAGLRYLRGSRVLLMLMGMAFIPMMIGMPYQPLLPVFADRSLAQGAEGLGQLYAANGVGALVGSLLVAAIKIGERTRLIQIALGAFFGLALAALGLSHDFSLSMLLLFFVGMCVQAFLTLNNALIMINSPVHLYGRIMSIYFLTFSVLPLATFGLSALAESIGVSPTFTWSGLLVTLAVLGLGMWNPMGRGEPATET